MPEVARAYGGAVSFTYGASGNFFAQIQNGAPFDLFLSADTNYPRRLLEAGAGVRDSLFTYGRGRIVVWVPENSPLNPATALQSPALSKLAIANPAHAPYGRAAEAALKSLGLYGVLENKLVLGENVAQAFAFARSGAADAGIVALPAVLAPAVKGHGRYWEVPQFAYPPMEQAGIILRPSEEASRFRNFLLSARCREVLLRYGIEPPEPR